MVKNPSRSVTSNQVAPHDKLQKIVSTHLNSQFSRPIEEHNITAFNRAVELAKQRPIIFDSGCGNGKSTQRIALEHPDAFVIGIDKSFHRLNKNNHFDKQPDPQTANFHFARADVIDFWRLANASELKLHKHFILYPNPWPKKKHLQRRWHGSPVFPDLMALGGELEVRSNWKIYLNEMQLALSYAGVNSQVIELQTDCDNYFTDFEKKYAESGQTLWQLKTEIPTVL